ncbi:D-alanyl-D-alanine carboxypeptidase family protein [Mesorhizobium sp. SB112]|uniref:D-alanyl-D-alanine carboxypeptidase n=1 Tax=Mesorhizobium sp. SB112 TaxID=3151853 RepID=UPI00326354A0
MALRTLFSFKGAVAASLALAISLTATVPASANPKYAAIVIDANSGKTLFQSSADEPRFPASLTKMMTLYMVFEAMSSGKLTKETRIPFSAQAAAMPPTKIGVKAGNSVTTETVILSLVTKSANDAAAAMGEYLGGSEQGFARLMTQKAKQLGMNNTVFRNASGLPNDQQLTTARDMAILGIALREHYPQYYSYFSTKSFTLGRQRMGNHNRLLGRVRGVDGIKTGYTRASGFNLTSSVVDGDRSIVAVVMGGKSGASRDNHMADLIKKYLPAASTRDRGPLVARAGSTTFVTMASAILPKKNAPTPDFRPDNAFVAMEEVAPTRRPSQQVASAEAAIQAYAASAPRPQVNVDVDPVNTASVPSGWVIQVASSTSQSEAQAFLSKTSGAAPQVLADASPFTVPFQNGNQTYYRARFAGFVSKDAAWNACGALKKQKIACYAVQQ